VAQSSVASRTFAVSGLVSNSVSVGSGSSSNGAESSGMAYSGDVNPTQRSPVSVISTGSLNSGWSSRVPVRPPRSSSVYSGGMGVNIEVNQIIYVDSPGYGAEGYGWWRCSEEISPNNATSVAEDVVVEYAAGTYVIDIAVMEYVHINGGIVTSTETICLTT
jgi:hypothetical protein